MSDYTICCNCEEYVFIDSMWTFEDDPSQEYCESCFDEATNEIEITLEELNNVKSIPNL
jgi:hypothetical protein